MGRFFGTVINGVIDLLCNNNVRLAILWLFIISHGIFNCAVVGFGPAATPSYEGMSAERQESLKSLNPKAFDNPDQRRFGGKFRFWSWLFWFVELVAGAIYIPVAFFDEARRQAKKATRAVREDRGRMPPPQQAPQQTTRPQSENRGQEVRQNTFWHKVLWLTEITEIVTDFFRHRK